MQTIGKPIPAPPRSIARIAASVAAHALILACLAGAYHHSARFVAPYRLPGSQEGHNFVVSYLPNRAPAQSAASKAQPEPKPPLSKTLLPALVKQTQPTSQPAAKSPASPDPNAASGADALGSGNISIALTSYFPPPHPDLSALPRGTHGDVILDIVIDTDGKVAKLEMMSGVGYGVDQVVIATVEQWLFHPATQNGHPVASEQELHFHYERG